MQLLLTTRKSRQCSQQEIYFEKENMCRNTAITPRHDLWKLTEIHRTLSLPRTANLSLGCLCGHHIQVGGEKALKRVIVVVADSDPWCSGCIMPKTRWLVGVLLETDTYTGPLACVERAPAHWVTSSRLDKVTLYRTSSNSEAGRKLILIWLGPREPYFWLFWGQGRV